MTDTYPTWPKSARLTGDRLLELRREHGLSLAATLLLSFLADHDLPDRRRGGRRKGVVWWGVRALAGELALAERTIHRGLGDLVAAGLIVREQRGRGLTARTVLRYEAILGLTAPPARSESSPAKPAAEPCQERPNQVADRKLVREKSVSRPAEELLLVPYSRPPAGLRDVGQRMKWIAEHSIEVPARLAEAARTAAGAGRLEAWASEAGITALIGAAGSA